MPETKEHFADLPEEERIKVQLWIRAMLKPTKNTYTRGTAELKNLMEDDNHVYTTIDQFDEALYQGGFGSGRFQGSKLPIEGNCFVDVDCRSLPFIRHYDPNIGGKLKHADRGALVSSVLLFFKSIGQLDRQKSEDYMHGSNLLCSSIFEKCHGFYGELLRDAVVWLMEEKRPGIGQDAAVDAVLEACGLASI